MRPVSDREIAVVVDPVVEVGAAATRVAPVSNGSVPYSKKFARVFVAAAGFEVPAIDAEMFEIAETIPVTTTGVATASALCTSANVLLASVVENDPPSAARVAASSVAP